MMHDLRCHHCSQWIGESPEPLEFVGLFKNPRDREMVSVPRVSYRCGKCGWLNVFRGVGAAWRRMELKTGT